MPEMRINMKKKIRTDCCQVQSGEVSLPDEDTMANMYHEGRKLMQKNNLYRLTDTAVVMLLKLENFKEKIKSILFE